MAKKAAKRAKGKRTPSSRRAGSGRRAAARSGAGAGRSARSGRKTGRRTAGAKTPKGKAKARTRAAAAKPVKKKAVKRAAPARSKRAAAAKTPARVAPDLNRVRRQLTEVDENVPTPPSSLNPDRRSASAARSGRQEMKERTREHTETSPVLTGGDVDADWEDAYSVGDEAPGGDNPTPDQDRVDDIGRALGVEYQDNEELRAADKISDRDKHRWELDPASSEDYPDRD
jgi:hypothetical protein